MKAVLVSASPQELAELLGRIDSSWLLEEGEGGLLLDDDGAPGEQVRPEPQDTPEPGDSPTGAGEDAVPPGAQKPRG